MSLRPRTLAPVLTMLVSLSADATDRFTDVEITVTPMGGAMHMLSGQGGNIGVSAGEDGILIIDDQYEPLAEKIAQSLSKLGSDSPKFIINTHYHGDHTGSNSWFHTHKGSTIMAHENVRVRLLSDDNVVDAALPKVTYQDGINIYFNDETLKIIHFPKGHTDGDSVVWIKEPNILHTGDLFFNGLFPYIDLKSGGSVAGYIDSVKTLLEKIDESTKIIPGHGPQASKSDYENFLSMIENTKAFVEKHKAEGKSVDDIVAMGLDKKWKSWHWEFITEEKWIRTLY
ncbi:MBL fold metallo-hydrolase [Alteromonas sp. ASW11-130]|uniref:MBL fold metallo-hydrolase n=1 Tax=Alteromonas sp. ASW11-130 TaxID=3015775 RepID=UPI002242207F|nr:MBL fold metallo-hydrolase [Alteromonas sp. ASW11-130]MCW8092648.1 MBL fold metallo-hydrolase [Alteromonas sp. ASW11-130]